MKPIIISVTEEKDGYIRLKKEDLEKYIEDAYQTGVRDGRTLTIPTYREPMSIPTSALDKTCPAVYRNGD